MIKQEERETIIQEIESNYCFNDNIDKWKQLKEKILQAEGENNQEAIDLLLCKMGDSHLRAHNMSVPSKINLGDLLVKDGKVYLFHKDKYCAVHKVDGKKSSDILREYEKKYNELPTNVQYGELTKDFKFCRGEFRGDQHTFEFSSGEQVVVSAGEVAKMKEYVSANVKNMTFEPIIAVPVDDNTVLLKIVTLNYPGISGIFEDKLNSQEVSRASNIILDLRDNQGGLIDEAGQILSLLLKKDVIMPYHIISRDERLEPRTIRALQHENLKDKKLFVFINRYTMSAAEYVIALGLKAANDKDILLIGERTAGSTGQAKVFRISDECMLYVTTKRYLDKNGKELTEGIEPDIELDADCLEYKSVDGYLEWFRREIL